MTDQAMDPGVDLAAIPGGLPAAIEAVCMVAEEPVAALDLAAVLGAPLEEVESALRELAAEYRGERGARPRGFELRCAGGGWRIYSAPAAAGAVEAALKDGRRAKLTQAALETLAIIAYRGPISRGRIGAIRGVSADSAVRTLQARGLVDQVATEESSGAALYATTRLFLERMGMTSLDELAPLAPHLPGDEAVAEIQERIDR
jgi:segregation and condensation protein B